MKIDSIEKVAGLGCMISAELVVTVMCTLFRHLKMLHTL